MGLEGPSSCFLQPCGCFFVGFDLWELTTLVTDIALGFKICTLNALSKFLLKKHNPVSTRNNEIIKPNATVQQINQKQTFGNEAV